MNRNSGVLLPILVATVGPILPLSSVFAQPMAEPENVEYVRVCDLYGSGFFYIPGSETCLKLSGYVRTEYVHTSVDNQDDDNRWKYRARLNFDARSETEYGTLRSLLRIQADGDGDTDASAGINQALISLGGLRVGYTDTFFNTNHNDGWLKAANDGYYSDDQAILLDYTFGANGFSATIGLQDIVGDNSSDQGIENPDIYAGVSYQGDWGRLAGSLGYDGVYQNFAGKASLELSLTTKLKLHGWYSRDNDTRFLLGAYSANSTEGVSTNWEWGADINYQYSPTLNLWAGYSDADNPDSSSTEDLWRAGVGFHWNPVQSLSFRPEAVMGDGYNQYRFRVVRLF